MIDKVIKLNLKTGLLLIAIFEFVIIFCWFRSVSFAQALGIVFILICVLPVLISFTENKLDPCEPIYYFTAYLAVSIGIRGLIILSRGSYIISPIFQIGTREFDDLVFYAFVVSILGLLAFLVGYYINLGENFGKKIPLLKCSWSTRNILYTLTFATIVGLFGLFLYLNSMGGGFINAIVRLRETSVQQSGIQYYYFPMMWFLVACLLILYAYMLKYQTGFMIRMLFVAYFIVVVALYLVTGSKWLVFTLIMSMYLAYHYLYRRLHILYPIIIMLSFLASWPVLYAYQAVSGDFTKLPATIIAYARGGWFALAIGRSYGLDSMLMILDRVKNITDLKFGSTLLDIFYFYIPRSLWTNKPLSFSRYFAVDYMSHTKFAEASFVSPSLIGELYMNWHIVGVVGGMFLVGVFQRAAYSYLMKDCKRISSVLLYSVTFLAFIHLVEGCISAQIEIWLSWIVPMAIVLLLLGCWESRGHGGNIYGY